MATKVGTKAAVMKSGKQRDVFYEQLRADEIEHKRSFILAHYLESMQKANNNTSRPKSGRSHTSMSLPASQAKIRRFGSQPSLYEERSNTHMLTGTVSKKTVKEMGAYAWTPLATRTAVGYGEDPPKSLKKRPISAPVYKTQRATSFSSIDTKSSSSWTASLVSSHSSLKKRNKKNGYMAESLTLCVHAFANGTRNHSVRVTAKSILQLLEEATLKLSLPSAGRKIFLPDGTQVTDARQLYKDCNVYISMGESFKDPYDALRDKERMKLSSSWTMGGIMLPDDKKSKKKVPLSKRMKDLVESQKRRILVFRNGESREGVEVIANRFDEFMVDCTAKLGLSSVARALYDWQGKEIHSFSEVPALDELQQQQSGSLLGPLWVTRGERFSPTGAYDFLMSLAVELKQRIKFRKERLEMLKAREDGKEVDVQEIMSMTHVEVEKEINEITTTTENERKSLKKLKSNLKMTAKKRQEEASLGSSYKFQHISEVTKESRLLGTKGYRVKLKLNGQPESGPIITHFSNKDLQKGRKTKEELLQAFFDMLNCNEGLKEAFIGHGRRGVFRRAFQTDGKEINDFSDINIDDELWLSFGEDFVPFEFDVITLTFDKVQLLNLWDKKSVLKKVSWLGADENTMKPSSWQPITAESFNDIDRVVIPNTIDDVEKTRMIQDVNAARIPTDSFLLQCKKDAKLVLYPDIQMTRVGRDQDTDVSGVNEWILSRDGIIMNKAFRNIVLCLKQQSIFVVNGEEKLAGYSVGLADRQMPILSDERRSTEPNQEQAENAGKQAEARASMGQLKKWRLTPDGHIVSAFSPNLFLTNISGLNIEIPVVEKPTEEEKAKKSSSSSSNSSSDEKTSSKEDDNEDETSKKKKKLKKKSKKEKKKWWDFGGSSNDSSDIENGKEKDKRNSSDSVIVRMHGTSSEDDKAAALEEFKNDSKKLEDVKEDANGDDDEKNAVNDLLKSLPDQFGGETFVLGVFEKFSKALLVRQRWAVKKQDPSEAANDNLPDKWARQGLTWPVNEADTWVEEFVDGFLLPCAPKLKRKLPEKEKVSSPFYGRPARLKVLKNGEPDQSNACSVVGPDLSNMTKKVTASLPLKWKREKGEFRDVQPASAADVELEQFLDKCTEALSLPFAARRLFDENGKELFALSQLDRDQIVYVSTGDAWINPNLTHSEQQRRLLLANLASDVCKIRNFITLRNQEDLIFQVDGPIQAGSGIVLKQKPIEEDKAENESEAESPSEDNAQEQGIRDLQKSYLTAHQIAHIKSEERMKEMREQFQQDSGLISNKSTIDSSEEEFPFTNSSLARKFSKPIETSKLSPNAFRQWVYHDGFIQLKINKKLVLGVQQNEETKGGQPVILCNKKLEDSFQRWLISEDGFIRLKCNPQLVLTVATPLLNTDPFSEATSDRGYNGSRVILGRRLDCYNGNSHQMFTMDTDIGFINAFSTDLNNMEITAANKSSVCTYSVLGSQSAFQTGYIVQDGIKPGSKRVLVCESCGKSMRGKQKLQKIGDMPQFVCAIGTPEEFGITTKGSFRCLTSKVDLSYKEAESTLMMWEMQLKRLQMESSVRVIAYELNLAQTTPSVRICARKNGETSDGVIVIGNSINQFLDMSTYKLGLAQAARKLYTIDGELITDMSQLLQPYYPELCMPMHRTSTASNERKVSTPDQKQSSTSSTPLPPTSESKSVASDDTITPSSETSKEQTSDQSLERHVSFAEASDEKVNHVGIERMDVRVPVDVWISCGEPFVSIGDSEKRLIQAMQEREERALISNYLEQDKHRLRQLQGRRYSGKCSSQGIDRAVKPVLTRSLDEPSREEEQLEQSIGDLQLHLSELKIKQEEEQIGESKSRPRSAKRYDRTVDSKLYDLPRGVSVQVFPNGENPSRAVQVVASNLTELLDRATSRLDLNSAARRVFTTDGTEILDFSCIEKNQHVCVTVGEKFVPSKDRRHQIELRASWSRIKRGSDDNSNNILRSSSSSPLALPAPPSKVSSKEFNVNNKDKSKTSENNKVKGNRARSARPRSVPTASLAM